MAICSAGFTAGIGYYADDIYIMTGADAGLGGPYPTDNSGLETLFSNPAAFKSAEEDLDVSNLTLLLKGPIFDITTLVLDSMADGSEITDILASSAVQSILTDLYAGFTLTGPVYFGYIGDGFGFGLFNSTDFVMQNLSALSIGMEVTEQIILAGGYSFRIPLTADESHVLDLGVMLKGGVEGSVNIERSFLQLPAMIAGIGPDLLLAEPFDFSTLIGFDAGILYIWDGFLSVGISCQDIYSPTVKYTYVDGINSFLASGTYSETTGIIPMKLNAGFELSPEIPFLEQWITNFRFMAAYDDILDFVLYPTEADSPLLHIRTGLEITMLEILDLRVGIADGLLNAGFGLDLQILTLNAAMFGTELSSQPNTRPVFNLVVGFDF